jgi:hypothetical protein
LRRALTPSPSLDLEHVVAFLIGIAVAVRLSRSASSRTLAVGTADRGRLARTRASDA